MLSRFFKQENLRDSQQNSEGSITRVSLNYRGIAEIDQISSIFYKIKELYLNHNDITSLVGIEQFVSLEQLHLKYNKITAFEDISRIQSKRTLLTLNLKGNPVEQDSNLCFEVILNQFPNLKELNELKQSSMKLPIEEGRTKYEDPRRKRAQSDRIVNRDHQIPPYQEKDRQQGGVGYYETFKTSIENINSRTALENQNSKKVSVDVKERAHSVKVNENIHIDRKQNNKQIDLKSKVEEALKNYVPNSDGTQEQCIRDKLLKGEFKYDVAIPLQKLDNGSLFKKQDEKQGESSKRQLSEGSFVNKYNVQVGFQPACQYSSQISLASKNIPQEKQSFNIWQRMKALDTRSLSLLKEIPNGSQTTRNEQADKQWKWKDPFGQSGNQTSRECSSLISFNQSKSHFFCNNGDKQNEINEKPQQQEESNALSTKVEEISSQQPQLKNSNYLLRTDLGATATFSNFSEQFAKEKENAQIANQIELQEQSFSKNLPNFKAALPIDQQKKVELSFEYQASNKKDTSQDVKSANLSGAKEIQIGVSLNLSAISNKNLNSFPSQWTQYNDKEFVEAPEEYYNSQLKARVFYLLKKEVEINKIKARKVKALSAIRQQFVNNFKMEKIPENRNATTKVESIVPSHTKYDNKYYNLFSWEGKENKILKQQKTDWNQITDSKKNLTILQDKLNFAKSTYPPNPPTQKASLSDPKQQESKKAAYQQAVQRLRQFKNENEKKEVGISPQKISPKML